ncbi:hypothetical protein HGK72_23480 [Mycolicibacterium fortuitum]|uniref:hypothetical protein n=1 Tax=Mycolicibacterium fortuitum TaxID=1766 RepID=UPI00149056D8|nr:hypothetical protein [Mycolicibacterium fortuitum]
MQLAASTFVDPVTRWMQVFEATSANLTEIRDYMEWRPDKSLPGFLDLMQAKLDAYGRNLIDPIPPVAEALVEWATVTLPTGLQTAVELAVSGQPEAAAEAVRGAVMSVMGWGMFPIMSYLTILHSVVKDLAAATISLTGALRLENVVRQVANLAWSPLLSLGKTAQAVIDSVEAGDLPGALSAVLNAPADAVDHFLNSPGGLVEFRVTSSSGTFTAGGLLRTLIVQIPGDLRSVLTPPIPVSGATAVARPELASPTMSSLDTATAAGELPETTSSPASPDEQPADPTEAESVPTADPTESEAAQTEDDATTVTVSSNGATDLSAGNKAVPGKTGTTSTRPAQQLRASVETAASQVTKGLNDIRDGIEKSVSGLKAGVKKASDGKTRAESNESDGDNS